MNSKAQRAGRCAINLTIKVILYADLESKIAKKFGPFGSFSLNQQSFISTNIFDFHKTSFAIGSARKIRNGEVYILKRL